MSTPLPGAGWQPRPGHLPPHRALGATSPGPIHYDPAIVWAAPDAQRRQRRSEAVRYVLSGVGGLGLLVMLWVIVTTAGGLAETVLPVVLAVIPLLIVLLTVLWVDRWEPEPWPLLLTAFLWGAGVATVISMVVNTTASGLAYSVTGDLYGAESLAAVVSAPLVEELTKGLGVLVIFLVWRRTFNGPVDGIVYAAVVAAGFAFAENILYFVQYSDVIAVVFVQRGLLAPFSHILFTACTGLAVGRSAQLRPRLAWVWMTPLGLVGAITLHAFWNGVVAANMWFYLLVELPFFLLSVGVVILLRHAERESVRVRLGDYQRGGWYVPAEVHMLSSNAGRSQARRWARARGSRALAAMTDFQKASSELAVLRQKAVEGHAEADFTAQERVLLDQVVRARRVFLGQA